jgi:hypothetical protein
MALMTKTTQSNFVTLTVDDLTKAIRNSIKNDVRSMPST